jgi:outer membrane protein TolC
MFPTNPFRRPLWILAAALASVSAGPARADTLDFAACLAEAAVHNPTLATAQAQLDQAKAKRLAASAGFLPGLAANASETWSGTGNAMTGPAAALGFSATQNLFNGFADIAAFKGAAAQVRGAEAARIAARAQAVCDLRDAFDQLIFAQGQVELTKGIAERQKDNRDLVLLRFESGNDNRGSLLQTEAALAQAEADRQKAGDDLVGAAFKLCQVLGRTPTADVEAQGVLDVPEAPDAPDYFALSRNVPAVLEAAAAEDSARDAVLQARGALAPSLNASASWNWPVDENGGSVGSPAQWTAGLNLSVPLFFGGLSAVAGYRQASAAERQSSAALEDAMRSAVVTLQSAFASYRNAVAQASAAELASKAAEVRAEIGRAEYGQGLEDFNTWTQIETALISAKTAEWAGRLNAAQAWAAWQNALGRSPLS